MAPMTYTNLGLMFPVLNSNKTIRSIAPCVHFAQ